MPSVARLALSLFLPLALSQSGCLPSSQRQNTRTLTPGDSLSRHVAATVPVDTLRLVWAAEAPERAPFEFPTSLVWLPDSLGGAIVVADTRAGGLHALSPEGDYAGWSRPAGLEYPYLAGHRADTLIVFSRGAGRLDFVRGDSVLRRVRLPEAFSAVLATDSALYAKRTEENDTFLARLAEDGRIAERYGLVGPHWRHFGFLRAWGDSVLSLSGYRPVVDVLRPETPPEAVLDTLALVGFDSPQLVRSHQFLLGEVDEPPLLTSAAAPLGRRLVAVNLRAEEIRLDVFAPNGAGGLRLERALVYPDAATVADAFPADLAVRQGTDGVLVVLLMQRPGGVFSRPGGRVVMLRWDTTGSET